MLGDLVREEQIAALGGDEEFERMLAELEGLDDAAVEAMLSDEGGTTSPS